MVAHAEPHQPDQFGAFGPGETFDEADQSLPFLRSAGLDILGDPVGIRVGAEGTGQMGRIGLGQGDDPVDLIEGEVA